MRQIVQYLVISITLVASLNSSGQFKRFKNYTVTDGLPSSQIYDIIEDRRGFIWFATDMGVSRFNGYEFKNLSTQDGLPNNSITKIFEDYRGRIWFISFTSELSYWENNHVHSLNCNEKLMKLASRNRVELKSSIYVDEGDTVWLGAFRDKLTKIGPGWEGKDVEELEIAEGRIYICDFGNGNFVFGNNRLKGKNATIFVFDRTKFNYSISQSEVEGVKSVIKHNTSWLLSFTNSLIIFNRQGIQSKCSVPEFVNTLTAAGDEIYAGTFNGLLKCPYKSLKNWEHITKLDNKSVTKAVRDREQGWWFGTDGQGVYYLPPDNYQYYSMNDGLPESKITSFSAIGNKFIAGHQNSLISLIYRESIETYKTNPKAHSIYNSINGILPYNKNSFVAATSGKLLLIDTKGIIIREALKTELHIKKIVPGSRHSYWIIFINHIVKVDSDFKRVDNFRIKQYVDNAFECGDGTLLLCTMNGLFEYKKQTGLRNLAATNTRLGARIIDIVERKPDEVWMVTRGSGVYVKRHDLLRVIDIKNGLSSNMCSSLLIESDSVIWVGTNNGLNRLLLAGDSLMKISVFKSSDGLLSNDISGISEIGDQRMIVHNNGITVMNKSLPLHYLPPPPVHIETIIFGSDTVQRFNNSTHEVFNFNNEPEINFTGISYKSAGALVYKYRLEGINQDWNYTKNTSVKYQNLNPGFYRFTVYAQNSDGSWSIRPASAAFRVKPAWWQTWWFKVAAIVLVLLLILQIFRMRLKVIKAKNDEDMAIQRTMESSELKALRAQMNPHFIFNSLNSIQKYIMLNDQDKATDYLNKFSKLIRNILEQSGERLITLEKELQTVELYLKMESMRFDFSYEITVIDNVDAKDIEVLPMLLQPHLENAIWHGLLHKEGEKRLRVIIERVRPEELVIIIEDNGIGRKKAAEIKTNQSPGKKSLGLAITGNRMKLMERLGKHGYTLQMIDKLSETGESLGTKILITLYEHSN